MNIEEVNFQSHDARITGLLYIPDSTPSPGLIFCHGMSKWGFRKSSLYRRFIENACERGYTSLIFDFRGSGNSSGSFDYGFKERLDVKAAIRYLSSRKEVISDKIFVVGHSLGGIMATYATRNEAGVRGLALWSTPPKEYYTIRNFIINQKGALSYIAFILLSYLDKAIHLKGADMKIFGFPLRLSLVRKKFMTLSAGDMLSIMSPKPTVVLVGDNDEYVTLRETKTLFFCIKGPKKLTVLRQTNHSYHNKEKEIIEATLAWFDRFRDDSRMV
ncbi:MAG: alpha/beta hydrolase [Candidatus Hodarchaeota archaeon]